MHVIESTPKSPRTPQVNPTSNASYFRSADHAGAASTKTFAGGGSSSSAMAPGNSGGASSAQSYQHHHARRPSRIRKAGEVDMLDGVVDMDAFSQILALDDGDQTKEFSRTLVGAWCEQAEHAVEEMEQFLAASNIVSTAQKAHYLKGSSSSLGLTKVWKTCQSIYLLHYPPSLAQLRGFSYSSSSDYSSSSNSSAGTPYSSGSGDSTSSSGSSLPPFGLAASSPIDTFGSNSNRLAYSPPLESPGSLYWDKTSMDFDTNKLERAKVLLRRVKAEIKEASDWLCKFYDESDKYAGI